MVCRNTNFTAPIWRLLDVTRCMFIPTGLINDVANHLMRTSTIKTPPHVFTGGEISPIERGLLAAPRNGQNRVGHHAQARAVPQGHTPHIQHESTCWQRKEKVLQREEKVFEGFSSIELRSAFVILFI